MRHKIRKRCFLIFGIWVLTVLAGCTRQQDNATKIYDLKVNNCINPIGIDSEPVFSWKLQDDKAGQKQTACQLLVSKSRKDLQAKQYVWDSGKVESDISVAIAYQGDMLEEDTEYVWQVNVWDVDGKKHSSEVSDFSVGKLSTHWENTEWISFKDKINAKGIFLSSEYTISYKFRMDRTATGFIWGADKGRYGDYQLAKFDATGETVIFEMQKMHDEVELGTQRMELESLKSEDFIANEHQVQIVVKEDSASTSLDGMEIVRVDIDEIIPIAAIGLFVERGSLNAWYDDILVTNIENEVLYQESFNRDTEHIFSPYYLKVEDGWARADSGFVVVSGYEVPAPMFRKQFTTADKKIVSAKVYATALGIYDISVNGIDICEDYASPGQSYYYNEVYYRTYDISSAIVNGENAIGILLGHGRYDRAKEAWGEKIALYAQILIQYEDGEKQVIGTDDTWRVYSDGPVRSDDIYSGEYYDANYEVKDWSTVNCDETTWEYAAEYELSNEIQIKAAISNSVQVLDTIYPKSVEEPLKGVYVYDFGQNFNGVCSIRMKGKAGQTATIRYAEFVNLPELEGKDDNIGTVYTRNLLTADNTDYYTFASDEEIVYTPSLTYRGFRYMQISGLEQAPVLEDVQGLVVATNNERTGFFECSDENMNRLYNSIYWTQLSNYVDIPTDCPQRDERFGWTGDAQVFAHTGALNANTENFMRQYLASLRSGQTEEGAYLQVSPDWKTSGGSNGWSDAGIILVWEMYQQFGDKQVIRENLEAMCKYVDYLVSTSKEFIREYRSYNDHNSISRMDDTSCNTAQCAYVMNMLAELCQVIGEEELAGKYQDYFEQYRKAWQEHYLNEDGSIGSWLQTEYVLALAYGLYPEELEQAGAEKLKISIEASDYHVTTGYITTPHLLKTLCKYGYADIAYKMVQQTGYPSWNEMLDNGSTTMTEQWNSVERNTDGTISINGSLNHLGLGSMGEWFYTEILGIKRDENNVAYKHFYLQPYAGGSLSYARGAYESMYGKIVSEWYVEEDMVRYHFEIPANTSATLTIEGSEYQDVELISGSYDFEVPLGK